ARGAISGLGEQDAASGVGAVGEPARVAITHDEELAAGGLARPLAARAHLNGSTGDRATAILRKSLSLLFMELDGTRPNWRSERIGIALATSSGGMRGAEAYFKAVSAHEPISKSTATSATYFAPMTDALSETGISFSPATLVLTACAASTIAIGIGTRWLEAGDCDLVIAGGFDAVSVFVASGFEVLRATTGESPPKPFCQGRDGMSLGEGAGLLALVDVKNINTEKVHAYVAGFGASADAVHLTAPDRTGAGLARAAEAALSNAEMIATDIDLVSAHATATPFNDAAEIKALARVMKEHKPTILPLKAQIGHTLGAAGALETLACVDAIERNILPASASHTQIEPDLPAMLHARARAGEVRAALKMSAAFGGANAALVITRDRKEKSQRCQHDVFVSRAVLVDEAPDAEQLSSRTAIALDKILRGDDLCRYALAALGALEDVVGSLKGAGVVIGHSAATLETNYLYYTNYQIKGARFAEPRRFPYTTPNAVAGECGVAFGLTGPGLAVGSGFHGGAEALAIGAALVRAGDAEKMVVVAVDEIGDVARTLLAASGHDPTLFRSGAVAVLLSRSNLGHAKIDRAELIANSSNESQIDSPGHRALILLCAAEIPGEIHSSSPHGSARISLSPSARN
ncbi:MAG: beta-ketoacyl synthase N-terminal-like domain-containing protein, partial [Polyangiaceae bacterium]